MTPQSNNQITVITSKPKWHINIVLNRHFLHSFIIIQYYILKGKIISTCGLCLQAKEPEKIPLTWLRSFVVFFVWLVLCFVWFLAWECKTIPGRNTACILSWQRSNSLPERPQPLLMRGVQSPRCPHTSDSVHTFPARQPAATGRLLEQRSDSHARGRQQSQIQTICDRHQDVFQGHRLALVLERLNNGLPGCNSYMGSTFTKKENSLLK